MPDQPFALFIDNASIHNEESEKLLAYCDKFDIQVIFNVKYRPDFNGIEGVWGWAKKKYRARIDWMKASRVLYKYLDPHRSPSMTRKANFFSSLVAPAANVG